LLLSVIVCTHHLDNHENLVEAIESLLRQTYDDLEIIVVVDGNERLFDEISRFYQGRQKVKTVITGSKVGVCGARNTGIRLAQGAIVAFTDDDVVADTRWIENLVDTYQRCNAVAVGGKILPIWLATEPEHFPAELGWLVGITHNGFVEDNAHEVRNTFGPNMSYRKDVFDKIGVFNECLGLQGADGVWQLQGEEAEFALRMRWLLGHGVVYNPEAVVYHKVPQWKTVPRTMLRRSFYQGYSKALLIRSMRSHHTLSVEQGYVARLLVKYIPCRAKRLLLAAGRIAEFKKLVILVACVCSTALGFFVGFVKGTRHCSA